MPIDTDEVGIMMDPNEALKRAKAGDKQAGRDLKAWVKGGGFEPSDPNWRKYC